MAGCLDPLDPFVVGIGPPPDESVAFKLFDQPRDRGRAYLFGSGQLAHGDRASEDDYGKGRGPRRRETGSLVLDPQPSKKVDGSGMQAIGKLEKLLTSVLGHRIFT